MENINGVSKTVKNGAHELAPKQPDFEIESFNFLDWY